MILALDLGTTGNRAIVFDKTGNVLHSVYKEFQQFFPNPGWVEHDPIEIWEAVQTLLKQTPLTQVQAIGITNQRETIVVWDKQTGKPVYNAIVWQCRRTTAYCEVLKQHEESVHAKTGLWIDPYFSATKITWILDNVPDARDAAKSGKLLCGTIDTWILWNLTSGKVHATDPSNAARTLLYDIYKGVFCPSLCDLFNVPMTLLPEVRPSAGYFGHVGAIPITGVLGDQQAALLAQSGGQAGVIKNTYGTGLFLMGITTPAAPVGKLIKTIAWDIPTPYPLPGGGTVVSRAALTSGSLALELPFSASTAVDEPAFVDSLSSKRCPEGGVVSEHAPTYTAPAAEGGSGSPSPTGEGAREPALGRACPDGYKSGSATEHGATTTNPALQPSTPRRIQRLRLSQDPARPGLAGRALVSQLWGEHAPTYTIEASVFTGGSIIQWLRDGLGLIKSASDTEAMATSLTHNDGVYCVPALTGLGAPYWDPDARGMITGITRGTTKNHIVRAALESLTYQTRDMIIAMAPSLPAAPNMLRVDGGAAANNWLMQFQADILGIPVDRPKILETTALGAAAIAGIGARFWVLSDIAHLRHSDRIFIPTMSTDQRNAYYENWQRAVSRSLTRKDS